MTDNGHLFIIGITGAIGHGKTTLANAMAEIEPKTRHFESSSIIIEIVDTWHAVLDKPIDPHSLNQLNGWIQQLPQILYEILGIECTFDQLKINHDDLQSNPVDYQKLLAHIENIRDDFNLARTPITNENKATYRPILQWLGGYLVQRIDKTIWYKEIIRRMKAANESGIKLCVSGGLRFPNEAEALREVGGVIVKIYRPGYGQSDVLDPTERERENIQVDTTIINEGTEHDLKACAAKLLDDIKNQQIQQTYRP